MNTFWGMKIMWMFFWRGHHKTGLVLEVTSMHLRVFPKGQGSEWEYFMGLLIFQILLWVCRMFLVF